MENGRKPITQESRNRKRAQLLKRRKKIMRMRIGICVIAVLAIVGGAFLYKKYSPSKEQADFNKYYGIEQAEEVAVIVDDEILGGKGKIVDGKPYVEGSPPNTVMARSVSWVPMWFISNRRVWGG